MGNNCCSECNDYIFSESYVIKEKTPNLNVCGYPFCCINIKKLKNDSLLVKFNGTIYCSKECWQLHKKSGYIGYGWDKNNEILL